MRKNLLALVLAAILVLAAVPAVSVSAADSWDGTTASAFAGGTGTSATPYKIATGEQLAYLANVVNSGSAYSGKYYVLVNDISLSGLNWTPIGTETRPFTGEFDANGYSVQSFRISSLGSCQGLFGNNAGTIKNLSVKTAQITADNYFAGIVGKNSGTVINCSADGGITLLNASTASASAGAVCGYNTGSLINCVNSGAVSSWANYSGAICGYNRGGVIDGCYNSGELRFYEGSVVGGICGYSLGGTVKNCYNNGVIFADNTKNGAKLGGICGAGYDSSEVGNAKNKIYNCYNAGEINVLSPTVTGVFGGICGHNAGSVQNCYNVGSFDLASIYMTLGAICGEAEGTLAGSTSVQSGEVKNCYYLDYSASRAIGAKNSSAQISDIGYLTSQINPLQASATDGCESLKYAGSTLVDALNDWVRTAGTGYTVWYRFNSLNDNFPVLGEKIAKPFISVQPQNAKIPTATTSATFFVRAAGTGISYQWYYRQTDGTSSMIIDDEVIDGAYTATGAGTNTLTISKGEGEPNKTIKDFYCVVTNAAGSIESQYAALTDFDDPIIRLGSSASKIAIGSPASLKATFTSDHNTYTMRRIGWCVNDIESTTGATVLVENRSNTFSYILEETGIYYFFAYVDCSYTGSGLDYRRFYSPIIEITVTEAPPVIGTQPVNATILSSGNAQFEIAASGTNLSYQWYKAIPTSTVAGYVYSLIADGKDVNLTYSGTQTNCLKISAEAYNTSDYTVRYSCFVSNKIGEVRSSVATLTVRKIPLAPIISVQPTDLELFEDTPATFTIGVSTTDTDAVLSYQWYKNTAKTQIGAVPLAGKVGKSLTLDTSTAGTTYYYCVITSTRFTLTSQTVSNIAAVKVSADPSLGIKGDLNNDGEVDSMDASLILQHDAGLIKLTAKQLGFADLNGDGEVDSMDASLILQYDAGLI